SHGAGRDPAAPTHRHPHPDPDSHPGGDVYPHPFPDPAGDCSFAPYSHSGGYALRSSAGARIGSPGGYAAGRVGHCEPGSGSEAAPKEKERSAEAPLPSFARR
ncbi:MAG: hypothetical protein ACUVSG_02475, partial [Anaerolineae bacterium]